MIDAAVSIPQSSRRSGMPGILAGALLVYMVLLGGSEAGVFLAPLQVINAALGAVLVIVWIRWLGQGADLVDRISIVALLLFLIACVTSTYPRQSFDAATAALTWSAAFGVGRRLLAEPRYRLLCMRLLGVCAGLLAVVFLLSWGSVWVGWIQATGEAPPLDLDLPERIYRHHYVVAMLLATLLPALAHLLGDRAWRIPALVTGAVVLGLAVFSGSRTVWLALGLTAIAALLLLRPSRRVLGFAVAMVAVAATGGLATELLGTAVDRLLTGATVSYRLDIWRSALGIWADHPLNGIGPGSIGIGLALTDLTSYYSFSNRHADNALIQLAAEGGLVGVAGAALACAIPFVGRVASALGWRAAILGLVMLAALSLTNNPTDSPNLVTLMVVYAALAAPFRAGAADHAKAARVVRGASWAAAGVVALAVAAVNAAAVAQAGIGQPDDAGRDPGAVGNLRLAVSLDPGMALYHRELGVALLATSPEEANRELETATRLNPADTVALRALALAREGLGEAGPAVAAAREAIEVRPIAPENWMVLALVANGPEAQSAISEALRLAPWLAGSPAWPEQLAAGGDLGGSLKAAAEVSVVQPPPRDATSLAWLIGIAGVGRPAPDTPAFTGLEQVLGCDLDGASATYAEMGPAWAQTTPGIVGRLMLARLVDDPETDALIQLAALSQPSLAAASRGQVAPFSAMADPAEDQQLYRRMGVDPRLGGWIIPRTADALGAWMFAPREAAARSVPGSALASCRWRGEQSPVRAAGTKGSLRSLYSAS